MSSIKIESTIHVFEDTEGNFDIRDILASVGYTTTNTFKISSMTVVLPDGTTSTKDTPLFGKVDADTVYVRPGKWAPNYNGKFSTFELVLEQGVNGNSISLNLRVVIDPVNDAPSAANKAFTLADGAPVRLAESDFGFVDVVERDAFKSVIITSLPSAGKLTLDGVAVAVNTEISVADIQAGKLAFEPSQSASGLFEVGFKVRDAGGMTGTGALDTSVTPNYLSFKVPQAQLGDLVWEDSNGNGMQDAGEAGLDGVVVQLKDGSGKVVDSVTTHDGGQYSFTVDAGTYTVAVKPPAGYAFSTSGQGANAALDSDVGVDGTASVTLTPGQQHADLDAGVYRPASLSQVVWFDANRDGRLNDGETGAAGVRVTLLDATGAPVQGAVAVTDADGHYQFSNLKPGNYSVQFDKSSLPAGYNFTSAAQGGPGGVGSDADTGTGQTAQIALASGEDMVLRAGLVVQQATLGDRIWEDSNGNGVQDADEAGLVGVTVDLKDEKGNIVKTTTTGDDGHYSFTIDPGKYTVSVTAPAGMTATAQNAGTVAATDSDVNAAGQSAVITLAAGQVNKDVDAGFYKSASLGSNVWLDSNRNGLQDADEAGVAGVRVVLLDAQGKPAGVEAVTDQNGAYSFTNLKPGTYSVQFDKASLPAKHAFTIANAGADSALDSDANVSTGISAPVTLKSGDVNTTIDAGIVSTTGKLGDLVWEDSNANGIQDDGEQGLANVTVQLKDSSGNVVQTTTTGADGKYSFTADAGNYTVAVTAPKDYLFSAARAGSDAGLDSDIGSNGQSASVMLAAGDVNNSVDAGLYKTASVGDRVWLDKNGDGIQGSGEAGLADVKVSLLDANGKQVGATVTTDAKGNYQFSNLKPGTYSVQFDKSSLPEGMAFTKADAGADDALDSDANASGLSHSFTLTSGQVNKSVDAGVLAAATIGNRVWFDKNGNGLQDDGESGKSGVVMELRDADGKLVKSTTTDSNGNYKFSVEAGTYSVAMKIPAGFSTTTKNAGSNSAIDSDADASGKLGTVTVAAGDNVTHLDAGVYQKVEIGDKVWYDTNGDGVQQSSESGARGVKVSLLNDKGVVVATQTTDAKGQYLFGDIGPGNYSVKVDAPDGYIFTRQYQGASNLDSDMDSSGQSAQFFAASGSSDKTRDAGLVKAASIGDTVWEDSNYNGVRDASEKGVDGVTVKLYDANNVLKATTVTQDGGQYNFGNLLSGNYKVEVSNGSGWFFTKAGVGSDATDSDIVTVNSAGNVGRTGAIALGVGQNITTEDAGIYRKASIGDKVWRDSNHNGVQDAGEEGIGGILVGLFDATTKKQLGSTIKTDSNGNYKFTDLTPGSYYVVFDKTDVKFKSYNMSDWKWGVKNTGSNDAVDSDVIGDGKSLANVTKTDTITLTSGKNDMSWDAAITPIAIDLDGDGIHTIARADMTGSFDLLGTGTAIRSGWLSKGDGFLAVDSNGNGRIDDVSELFGGNGKGQGFAKLASYDSNGDGQVDASDSGFATLRIWQDANSNGQTDAGELISLAQAGVVSLTVAHTDLAFLDANHNLHMEGSSVTLSNGKSAAMTDVYFNVAAADAAAAGISAPTIADLLDTASQGAQATLVGQAPAMIV